MKNLDIFICGHRKFDCPVTNESYKILSLGDNTELHGDNIIRDDTLDNVTDINLFYSELSGYYWIYKNYELKDYVGFCHYRRYFKFLDNIPDMEKENCDIIVATPTKLDASVYNQYNIYHNIEDLHFVINVMCNNYNILRNIIFITHNIRIWCSAFF